VSRQFETAGAPHFPPQTTVRQVMLQVIFALLPGIAAYAWYFGPGILLQILLAIAFALSWEALSLAARRKPIRLFMGDLSAVVTAILFALCVPPLAPWWIALLGMFFAIVIAKHLFGGLGHNLFNPAMVGYVVVLISFPQQMTAWLPPLVLAAHDLSLAQALAVIATGNPPGNLGWDTLTAATPLDTVRTAVATGQMISEARQSPVFGDFEYLQRDVIVGVAGLGRSVRLWEQPGDQFTRRRTQGQRDRPIFRGRADRNQW